MSVVSQQDRLVGAWNFSAVHSAITFSVPYLVASFRGSFEGVAATFVDGKLSGAAKLSSVDVKDQNLAEINADNVQLDGELTIKRVTAALHATGTVEGPIED